MLLVRFSFAITMFYVHCYVSFLCRAVFYEKFKSQRSFGNEAMILGQLLHEVFQQVLLLRMEAGTDLSGAKLESAVREEMDKVLTSVDTLNKL